jgi:hypothetical protein
MTGAHGADIVALGSPPTGVPFASADWLGAIQGTATRAITLARKGDGL